MKYLLWITTGLLFFGQTGCSIVQRLAAKNDAPEIKFLQAGDLANPGQTILELQDDTGAKEIILLITDDTGRNETLKFENKNGIQKYNFRLDTQMNYTTNVNTTVDAYGKDDAGQESKHETKSFIY